MEIDNYGIYKNKIQELFDETCISLKELDDCHNGKEQLHDAESKIRNLFNELDFISARACSLYDTDEHEVGKWFADSSKDAFSALVVFCRVSKRVNQITHISHLKSIFEYATIDISLLT